jgi:hypothetical protein
VWSGFSMARVIVSKSIPGDRDFSFWQKELAVS